MKKINLMDIMESLNNDNHDDAQAALHEWFVEQGKKVQAQISGEPVEEQAIVENHEDDIYDTLDDITSSDALTNSEGYEELYIGHDETPAILVWVKLPDGTNAGSEVSPEVDARLAKLAGIDPSKGFEWAGIYLNDQNNVSIQYGATDISTDRGDDEEVDEQVVAEDVEEYGDDLRPGDDGIRIENEADGDITMIVSKTLNPGDDVATAVNMMKDQALEYHEAKGWSNVSELMPVGSTIAVDDAGEYRMEDGSDWTGPTLISIFFTAEGVMNEATETAPQPTLESYDDLVAELNEAFKGLETVSDKLQNQEGAQVGEQGKVPVNTKSTLPSHKGKDRLGGDPVEIKGKGHTGHALETAPKVVDQKVKNTVQNGKEELKKVADKGDKSALLNKMDGSVNTQSPISGKGGTGLKK